MADFFTLVGDALLQQLIHKRLPRTPNGLIVHLSSWALPDPVFSVCPCPVNPQGLWGLGNRLGPSEMEEMSIGLIRVDVTGSHTVHILGAVDRFPRLYINSNFEVFDAFFAEPSKGRQSPLQGLAKRWPQLAALENVSLHAVYRLDIGQWSSSVSIPFLTRFSADAREEGFMNINGHLLNLAPPVSWLTHVPVKRKRLRPASGVRRRRPSDRLTTVHDNAEYLE